MEWNMMGGGVLSQYLSFSVETQLQKLRVWTQQLFYKRGRQLGVDLLNNLHTKKDLLNYTRPSLWEWGGGGASV